MIANNVQESTTTTGTGNITLAGSSENGRTFSSQYAINERFPYTIDDGAGNFETGIGYLSGASTLVREQPQDGSATLPVNFGGGTKQIFVAAVKNNTIGNPSETFSTLGSTVKFMTPSNYIRRVGTNGLIGNRIYYIPCFFTRAVTIDLLAVRITTGAGTAANSIHIGVYDTDPSTGNAGNLLASVTDLDPSVAGLTSGSIPEMTILPGWFYLAIWSDVNPTLRSQDGQICMPAPFHTADNSNLHSTSYQFTASQINLPDLPAVGNANNALSNGGNYPIILVGHT